MNSVWLLSWNPRNWNWSEYSEWCVGTKKGKKYTETWTCHSKKPNIGDEFYLIKLGQKPRGIIGHGYIIRESYSAPHYNTERAEKGEKTNHIDVEFDLVYDYETEIFLGQEILKTTFPNQNWSPQGSGIQIRREYLQRLKMLWDALGSGNRVSVREQILQVCMNLFDEHVASIREYDDLIREIMPSGSPEAMIITEYNQCTRSLNKIREGYKSNEIINAWRYCNDVLQPITITHEPDTCYSKHEYPKETLARFAYSEEKKVIYLNVFYAALYARGWSYPLIETDLGLLLGKPVLEWLS